MGSSNVTTRELFHHIGGTERVRSAKADSVFRRLRQHAQAENDASTTEQKSELSPLGAMHSARMMMKLSSRGR